MLSRMNSKVANYMSWIAVVAMLVQPRMLLAQQNFPAGPLSDSIVDVELGINGVLHGQVVGKQGQQLRGVPVQISGGHHFWKTYTNQEGLFRMEGLVGSTYQVRVGDHTQIVRAWAAGTAPPIATKGLLIVPEGPLVLGQYSKSPLCDNYFSDGKRVFDNPYILAGLIFAAVAIPIAISDSDGDTPASP